MCRRGCACSLRFEMVEPAGYSYENLRNIYGIVEYSFAVITLCLHSLVIYLVLTKTPAEMKTYGRLVLNQTISEMLFIIVINLLVQPVLLYPSIATVLVGPLGLLVAHWGYMVAIMIVFLLLEQSMFTVTVCFGYRYRKLLNTANASRCSDRVMCAGLFIWYGTHALLIWFYLSFVNVPVTATWQDVLPHYPEWHNVPADRVILYQSSKWSAEIGFFAFALVTTNCVVDLLYFLLIMRKLAVQRQHFHGKTYKMLKTLTIGLLVQVISPIVCIVIPLAIFQPLRAISGTETGIVFVVNSFSYYHLVSAMATIYFIRPYRRAVLDYLGIIAVPLFGSTVETNALPSIRRNTMLPSHMVN